MRFLSPAKINMHLDIGSTRDDGYHEICSWFLMVDLHDSIDIDTHVNLPEVVVEGNHDVPRDKDLLYKAASLFYRETGIVSRCVITICKEIPKGGGLGGGSSNAATVLFALNRMHGDSLSPLQLLDLAARLGSDVPFFFGSPSALVTGRGEHLERLRDTGPWWVLIIDPGFYINTKDAFNWFDSDRGCEHGFRNDPENIRRLAEGPPANWCFFNAFSKVLYNRYPVLEHICRDLRLEGAIHASISGSGSACFGIFDSFSKASSASAAFSGYRFWLKETLARSTIDVLQ